MNGKCLDIKCSSKLFLCLSSGEFFSQIPHDFGYFVILLGTAICNAMVFSTECIISMKTIHQKISSVIGPQLAVFLCLIFVIKFT